MNKEILDLYTDYLISSFSAITATGLSALTDGELSHDQITRFLSKAPFTSKELWLLVKKTIRQIESLDGVIIIDDTIEEKPYTDENDIICWHYDHCQGRSVKGINLINCVYYAQQLTMPIGFEVVAKTTIVIDKNTGKPKRKADKTKNDIFRQLLMATHQNKLMFKYVLADVWYGSVENMEFIKLHMKKDFIFPLKTNRLVASSYKEKLRGNFKAVENFKLEPGQVREVYIQGLNFPVLLTKQVFTNKDGSQGIQYLVTSDLTLLSDDISTIYKKRWKVEEFHKSLKSNLGLSKSPTHTKVTQNNHLFACIVAFYKLERLAWKKNLNHFAIKAKLYFNALQASMRELHKFSHARA
jgi:hypothetical protein